MFALSKAANIINLLVSRRWTVLSLPLQWDFPALRFVFSCEMTSRKRKSACDKEPRKVQSQLFAFSAMTLRRCERPLSLFVQIIVSVFIIKTFKAESLNFIKLNLKKILKKNEKKQSRRINFLTIDSKISFKEPKWKF